MGTGALFVDQALLGADGGHDAVKARFRARDAHDKAIPQGGRVRGAQDRQHSQAEVLDRLVNRGTGRCRGDHVAGRDGVRLAFRAQAAGSEGSEAK